MNEIGRDGKQGKIDELEQRVLSHASNLEKACTRLVTITDKLYGCVPMNSTEKQEDQPTEGKVHLLEQAINIIGRQCNSMIYEIDRLSDHGIV